MDYEQAIEYIYSFSQFSRNPSLDRIKELCALLGNPQKQLKFVHVAGTNGKGSTCCMIANVLKQAGYKTGLFISPYVIDFRERMQVNFHMIPKADVVRIVEKIKGCIDQMKRKPREFEVVTALGLTWFAEQQCDIVVLEVGLGGRFDATNVIDCPLVSVITSISKDHTQILGDTIEQIAKEKCGIIKPNGITVCYPLQQPEAMAVIMQHCFENDNHFVLGNYQSITRKKVYLDGTDIVYRELPLHIPLAGEHQVANCITALETIFCLQQKGFSITQEQIVQGIANTFFPGRMERVCEDPIIILDGAHNPDGIQALCRWMEQMQNKRIILVLGMLKDKDYKAALQSLSRHVDTLITVTPQNGRALTAKDLAEVAKGAFSKIETVANAEQAITLAKKLAEKDDIIVISGSLYLVSQFRQLFSTNNNKIYSL